MSLNQQLAEMFHTMAAVLEIRGEPVFKAIAFTKVARVLEDTTADLRDAVAKGTLEEIEGIGKSSRKVIEEFVRTGKSTDYDELTATIPAGLLELRALPGLGPKTIAKLWKERDVKSIAELTAAIEGGKLAGLAGVGAKKIEQLKQSIAMRETAGKRLGIGDALPIANAFVERVRQHPAVVVAQVAGSLRRGRETIGDVDILCAVDDPAAATEIIAKFVGHESVTRVLGQGETKASVVADRGLQVDLRVVPRELFGAALQYFTGNVEHNKKLRNVAIAQGLTLNDWGLFRADEWDPTDKMAGKPPTVKPVASRTEAEIYEALGFRYVEPELREGRDELDLAKADKLPKLIDRRDLRGELHCHTTASDGTASIEQMAEAAKALGYEYLVITDHSKSQPIANGLDAKRLMKQVEAVRRADARVKGITILVGTECDILADGTMDYDDDVLKELDFVVGSPHTALRQDVEKATARILRAIDNKYVNTIGHPTGRLINQRIGLELDFARIFKAAKASGTALEVNASYPRLDLNDHHARAAREAGVTLSIGTDAHSTAGLAEIDLGLLVARRAGLEARHVLNARPLKELRAWVAAKR